MPFLGELRAFATPDLPSGWLPCDGRRVRISENQLLYNLLGTTYGGDGLSTFGLPDLRGRATAGVDERRGQPLGATSGLGDPPDAVIPFAVVRWAICAAGDFPDRG